LAVALLIAAPAHAARWLPPETVAGPVDTQFMETPAVVTGPRGRLAAAWVQRDGIGLALARGARPFGAPSLMPGSRGDFFPSLGIDGAGNTTVAWVYSFSGTDDLDEGREGVRAVARLRGGRFTKPREMVARRYDTFAPGVSIAPGGRSVVWWAGLPNEGAGARIAERPGRFGRRVLPGRDIWSWTFNPGGGAEIAIRHKRSLVTVQRSPNGRIGSRRKLGEVRGGALTDVATDAHGVRAAIWHRVRRPPPRREEVPELVAAVRTSGARFAKPQRLARDPESRYLGYDLASGPTGLSIAAWTRRGALSDDGDSVEWQGPLYAALSRPGRRFGAEQRIERRHAERPISALATAASRRSAVLVWCGIEPDGTPGIYAARAGAEGRFGRPVLVSRGGSGPVSAPAVALRPNGDGVVVWLEGLNVRAARLVSAG
jgi:hypothetical protein